MSPASALDWCYGEQRWSRDQLAENPACPVQRDIIERGMGDQIAEEVLIRLEEAAAGL
jgi:hypothetical protein